MTYREIKNIAESKNLEKETIDKDWVLGHFLNAFYSFSGKLIEKPSYRKIFHPYSDSNLITQLVPCYSLTEIMAEKLRSLIQRNRPRDIYDIWYIHNWNKLLEIF